MKRSQKKSPAAQSKASADPLQGWKARGCAAEVKDGIVKISKLTDASFLGFSAAGHRGPGTVKFRIKAAAGTSRLDWLPGGVGDKPQSVPFSIKGGDWEEIMMNVPAAGPLGIVRLYLPQQELSIELDWIEIVSFKLKKTTRSDF